MMTDFTYKWNLTDLKKVKRNGLQVFSCFGCGGGSSMGYKMAGYDVIGINEIDPKVARVYDRNFHPTHLFQEDIVTFRKRKDIPKELYNLDILDGSPPCSTFSMAGSREKSWDESKKFKEGQVEQVLSDLFFEFVALAKTLQPKVVVAENVKGLIYGNARGYAKMILEMFDEAGYNVQLFILNSASMGVPQKRERLFFICRRKDLKLPEIDFEFDEKAIVYGEVEKQIKGDPLGKPLTKVFKDLWEKTEPGKALSSAHPTRSFFGCQKVSKHKVVATIVSSSGSKVTHHTFPNEVSDEALQLCGSFPRDYDFDGYDVKYLIGMSVPPLMIYNVSKEIQKQIFKI